MISAHFPKRIQNNDTNHQPTKYPCNQDNQGFRMFDKTVELTWNER